MKPMLFNTAMTKAILDGRKTETRRVIYFCRGGIKPPCIPGDILYVRETWAAWSKTEGVAPKLYYKADGDAPDGIKWRPSIHMPYEAARVFLKVTSVRAERLQEIDDEGIAAEGLSVGDPFDELWDSTIKKSERAVYGWDANPYVWVIQFERIQKEMVPDD